MKCKEVWAYFEGDPFAALNPEFESAAFLEHTTKCGECNRLLDEQKELAKTLLLLRQSAPETPASLDASVVDVYRSAMSEASRSMAAGVRADHDGPLRAFRWVAAGGFAVIAVGAALLFISAKHSEVGRLSTQISPALVRPAVAGAKSPMTPQRSVRKKVELIATSVKYASRAVQVAAPENLFSPRFQGLMYCDQLSCPGAMDVIRVQLPSTAVAFDSTSSKAGDFVYADVLVGSDGIARGIRVVE